MSRTGSSSLATCAVSRRFWCSVHGRQLLLAVRGRAAYGDDMASDPQTELRLSRLENDSNSLYDLVTGISSTQQGHSRRFDAMDRRFDGMDRRFDAMDRRFDSVEATLAEVVRRLPEPS
jgi:hypothetical protein